MKLLMDSLFVAALALGTYYFITEAALRGLDAMLWAHRQFRKWKHRHQPHVIYEPTVSHIKSINVSRYRDVQHPDLSYV